MNLNKTLGFAIIFVLFITIARLIPHIANFTPVLAMGLFGGAFFNKKSLSIIVPLLAMFLADFMLQIGFWAGLREYAGFHSSMLAVYGSIALIAILGWQLQKNNSFVKTGGFAIIASLLFFVITNFSVWLFSGFYPQNFAGLTACFTAAIPFFKYTLAATVVYSFVFFGSFEWFTKTKLQKSVA